MQEKTVNIARAKKNHNKRVMIFEPNMGGHYPSYIKHLINQWNNLKTEERGHCILYIVVVPEFLEQYKNIVSLVSESDQDNIYFNPISIKDNNTLKQNTILINRFTLPLRKWFLLCKYAKALKIEHCLITIIDSYKLPLALNLRSPCDITGIYFRPAFHYSSFACLSNTQVTAQEYIRDLKEKILIYLALKNKQLKKILCLDPYFVRYVNSNFNARKLVHLVDPVKNISKIKCSSIDKLALSIHSSKTTFLLLGQLGERRGLYKLLKAIKLLSATECQKICFIFVGQADEKSKIESLIQQVCQEKPVQIVRHFEYITEQEVYGYYRCADVILAIHQKHVGMSGSLVLAAASGKPVLASDYGLMGEITRRYQLGITVNSTKPEQIAEGLKNFLSNSPEKYGNVDLMQEFANRNTPKNFASTIFKHILKS